ncbi:hypothetical protein [Streptomyces sp. NPDC007074]|uniref:hypothetical protein n=1 Tax=Streptomyces sp. NPDC007074 TaxID=3156764 RepID=UPI0033FB82E7
MLWFRSNFLEHAVLGVRDVGEFAFNRDRTLVLPHEDAAGKAVPELVIDQMDTHLHLMGARFPHGEMEQPTSN